MSSDQILQNPASLKAMGETPAEVQAQLTKELDAFEAYFQTRQADWQRQQPGREWSPAQEVEHVMRVNGSVTAVLRLLLSDKPLRPSEQSLGELRNGKRQAPAGTLPSASGVAWEEVQQQWRLSREKLKAQAAQVRATPERTLWHPFYGELDALDWLRMGTGHLGHHRQLMRQAEEA